MPNQHPAAELLAESREALSLARCAEEVEAARRANVEALMLLALPAP